MAEVCGVGAGGEALGGPSQSTPKQFVVVLRACVHTAVLCVRKKVRHVGCCGMSDGTNLLM